MKKVERLKEIMKYLREAEYIGEEGGMCVSGDLTAVGAYRKMQKRMVEDCGEKEWLEFKEFYDVRPDNLGTGYLHLITDKDREDKDIDQDCEWYVSLKKISAYKVWVLWV